MFKKYISNVFVYGDKLFLLNNDVFKFQGYKKKFSGVKKIFHQWAPKDPKSNFQMNWFQSAKALKRENFNIFSKAFTF